jgi:hypothetical protein
MKTINVTEKEITDNKKKRKFYNKLIAERLLRMAYIELGEIMEYIWAKSVPGYNKYIRHYSVHNFFCL